MSEFDFVEADSAKIYTEVISQLMTNCNEPLYPGDERRIFGEALALVFTNVFSMFNDRAQQRVLGFARGEVLDALGERLRVYRLKPTAASAVFRFSVSAPQAENIVIPAGTRITADGMVYFATNEAGVLQAGLEHVDIEASCTEGGSEYNGYTPGSIGTLVDLIPFISGVVNTTITAGGDDGEPYTEDGDNRFRVRISLAPASLSPGTEAGYKYYALSADPDITSVEIDCPEDYPNEVNIYALMKGGAMPDADTLKKIVDTIEDANIRIMTDHVEAFAPYTVGYKIEIKYYCTAENEAATIEAIEGEGGAIDQYIEWQSGTMGRDINPDKLRALLFAAGAIRADIVSPSYDKLTKVTVAKPSGASVVTHEVVEE